jgi:hypothetical protein
MTNAIDNNLWEVEVFYVLPAEDEEFGIAWEEYVEKCSVLLPAHIEDNEEALKYIQKSSDWVVNLVSATPVAVEANQ